MNDDFSSFWDKALKFLSFRPRSEVEINEFLNRKKVSSAIQEKIIGRLKDLKLVDDEAFVNWWLEQRTLFKPRSFRAIKMELRQKGIANELIEKLRADYSVSDESQSAFRLAEKKSKRLQERPEPEIRHKLLGVLSRAGFSYETAKEAIDKLLEKE